MTTIIKFYADTPRGERNKLFKWRCHGANGIRACLMNFIKKGFYIRAAFASDYHKGVMSNNRRIELGMYPQDICRKISITAEHKNVHS